MMKKIVSPQNVVEQYVETCQILKETALSGDYKRGNKEGRKIVKMFRILENNIELANLSLPKLFCNKNVVTKSKAAAHCIALNIRVSEAEKILEEVANDDSYGIFRFNAEMTLKVWREQGYLKVYKEQIPRCSGSLD
ncbi:hypothetical protein FACS1894196_2470 [Clostridia bacterium]|nr:hypothetical protein FACS1894196_2470 [Clostridia bacterium]